MYFSSLLFNFSLTLSFRRPPRRVSVDWINRWESSQISGKKADLPTQWKSALRATKCRCDLAWNVSPSLLWEMRNGLFGERRYFKTFLVCLSMGICSCIWMWAVSGLWKPNLVWQDGIALWKPGDIHTEPFFQALSLCSLKEAGPSLKWQLDKACEWKHGTVWGRTGEGWEDSCSQGGGWAGSGMANQFYPGCRFQ